MSTLPLRTARALLPALLAGGFCALAPADARAACSFSTRATVVSFGNYDVSSLTPLTTAAPFTVKCTGAAFMLIQVGPSSNGGGYNPRLMKHTTLSDTLQYNLYQDPGYSTIWGDTTFGSGYLLKLGPPPTFNGAIYGRLLGGQDVTPGVYRDSITITVTL